MLLPETELSYARARARGAYDPFGNRNAEYWGGRAGGILPTTTNGASTPPDSDAPPQLKRKCCRDEMALECGGVRSRYSARC